MSLAQQLAQLVGGLEAVAGHGDDHRLARRELPRPQERFGPSEGNPAGGLHEDAFPGELAQDRWQRLILHRQGLAARIAHGRQHLLPPDGPCDADPLGQGGLSVDDGNCVQILFPYPDQRSAAGGLDRVDSGHAIGVARRQELSEALVRPDEHGFLRCAP